MESQYSFQFPIQLRAIQITQTSFAKHDYKNFLHYILVARNRAKHGEIHGVCWSTEGLSQGWGENSLARIWNSIRSSISI